MLFERIQPLVGGAGKLATLLLALIAALAGCQSGLSDLSGGLEPGADAALTKKVAGELPLPPGAKLLLEESVLLDNGGGRWVGRLTASFGGDPREVFLFMKGAMQRAGWTPLAAVFAETSVLTFTSADRSATVQIVPAGALGGRRLTITVSPLPVERPAGAPQAPRPGN